MPTVYDSKGQSYVLTNQIGRGGEGAVFSCPDEIDLVAKIYHEPVTEEKAEKLRWMAENQNEQLLKVAAWIVDTLKDESGKTVGFLMPNVKAKEIHELYSLKSRRVHFPEATWKFLIHAAANVARAFYSLHKNEHIMGDVNHGNCVVLRDGTVKLIDCDSYSVSRGDFRYRCEVGVATHLAPELQGADLGEIERETKHDNFGLAVIIFQLLFLGRHPFAGNYLGDEDKSLEDCIREYRFAYSPEAHLWNVKQPPGTLSLNAVSPRLAAMFERAFLTDDRPEPREWIEALEDLSESLKQCALHIGHFYFEDLRDCPWCALESQTGLMLFPFVTSARGTGDESFNIFTIENLVTSLALPNNLPAKPVKSALPVPPSPEAETARRENMSRFITLAILQFCIVVFLTAIAGPGVGFFIGALLMAGFIVTLNNSGKNSKVDLEVQLENARREWNQIETEWSTADTALFNDDMALIRKKIDEHHKLQQQSREKVKLLGEGDFQYKLDTYLASFKIDEAKLAGIGAEHIRRLKSAGIRTAADIDAKRLKSLPPPINEEVNDKILEWRKNRERNFEYKPDTVLPEVSKQRLVDEFAEKRGKIEREIENLLVSLRSGSTLVRQRQQHLTTRAEAVAKKLMQSESDLAAAGSATMPIVVLILITTLIPMFGNAFSSSRSTSSRYPNYDSPAVTTKGSSSQTKAVPMSSSTSFAPEGSYSFTVPDTITDKEIGLLTDLQKKSAAQDLLNQAIKIVEQEKDFSKAVKKLNVALRLEPRNTKVLNKLGELLYEQKKYKDSLENLNRSLLIDSTNIETKFLVGANYLKMEYYGDAQNVFAEITRQNSASFEGHYNLGQAYKGLRQYYSAVSSFRTATEIRPDNGEARYEYAFCLHQVGANDDVLREYQKLSSTSPRLAEKLRKTLGLKELPPPPATSGRGSGSGSGYGNGSGNNVLIR
jgi:DNA-binding helix-hairpin-helix protein with protein kinase domain